MTEPVAWVDGTGRYVVGYPMLRCESCQEDKPAAIACGRWVCPTCRTVHITPKGETD